MELANVQHVIRHLTNEIINIKRNSGEVTSTQCPYRPFFMRPIPTKPLEPPPTNLNIDLEGVSMKNLCNYHPNKSLRKNMFTMD